MKSLALLALLVAVPQDPPLPRTWEELSAVADRFAKGEEAAMRELLRAGRPALRVLAERRKDFPRDRREALARLMVEIRWTTARSDEDRALLARLLELPANQALSQVGGATWCFVAGPAPKPVGYLGSGFLGILDPALPSEVAPMEIVQGAAQPSLPHYDPLWESAKLDFDVLGGVLIVSTPERLWTPPPPGEVDPAAIDRAIGALGAHGIVERTQAEDFLRGAGPAALARLEKSGEEEAKRMAEELRRRWAGAIWDGPLAGPELSLPAKPVSPRLKGAPLRVALDALARKAKVEIEADSVALAGRTLTIGMENAPLRGLLAVITRPQGLDFAVVDGKIRIR